jgi:bla regulator protein blaR1
MEQTIPPFRSVQEFRAWVDSCETYRSGNETGARASCNDRLSPYNGINQMVTRRNLLFLSTALITIGVITAQSPGVPAWQTAAGGKMAFEVASVKPAKGFRPPIFPLNLGDAKTPGGRFSGTFPLVICVAFAYKLMPAQVSTRLPKSFPTDAFDIEARAAGNPTKDQMRLMMQSLLADRFKLKVHFEAREGPVFALTLVRPGHTGPKLRPHADGPACPDSFEMSTPVIAAPPGTTSDVFPPACGTTTTRGTGNGTLVGARDMTVEAFAEEAIHGFGSLAGEIDKPVVDQTGLKGRYDFTLELPAGTLSFSATPPNPDAAPNGTPFLDALRGQLGLKLVSSKGPIRELVIDHVEKPSAN